MKNTKGFALVEGLLILVIVGMLAGIGWYVWNASNKTDGTLANTDAASSSSTAKSVKPSSFAEYKNDELAFSMKYPSEWGDAMLTKGTFSGPQHGEYKQLAFSKQTKININFVIGPYGSPLDGCGITNPVDAEKFSLDQAKGSIIGWNGDSLKSYGQYQGQTEPAVSLLSRVSSDTGPGWVKIDEKDKTLIYTYNFNDVKAAQGSSDGPCEDTITQAQADEANAYHKFIYFAANYSNSMVQGVNAQYDGRGGKSQAEIDQLTEVLNTINKT